MIYRMERCNARASGDRSLSFFPVKGALTHHLRSRRWYCLRQPCALRGRRGSCGSLMDNATALGRCCHCPRSYRKHTRFCVCEKGYRLYPTLRQLPAQTCHRQLCRSYGRNLLPVHFLFRKRNKNKGTPFQRTPERM